MIDITVDNNEVEVDMRKYHSFNDRQALAKMLDDVIRQAKYSGETITLWIAQGKKKELFREWP